LAPAGSRIAGTTRSGNWSGKVQLTHKPTSDVLLYAGVARGIKGALLQAPAPPAEGTSFAALVVKPEKLTSYEAGVKTSLFDQHLTVNAGLFYYDYKNFQAYKFENLQATIFNADATNYGGELEVAGSFSHGVTMSFGAALLHTNVKDVSMPDGTHRDQQSALAPKYSLTASVRKTWQSQIGSLFVDLSGREIGSRYFSTINAPTSLAPSYYSADLQLGYASPDRKWDASLGINNITDTRSVVFIGDLAGFAGYGIQNFGPPRWATFRVRYTF
jgi:iron complex outermembrane receptor protein